LDDVAVLFVAACTPSGTNMAGTVKAENDNTQRRGSLRHAAAKSAGFVILLTYVSSTFESLAAGLRRYRMY
jgi:hypothetical protein